jgi:hypothetical protein
MRLLKTVLSAMLLAGLATTATAADLVRLGNLKFAGKYDLKIEEMVFAKGGDRPPSTCSRRS